MIQIPEYEDDDMQTPICSENIECLNKVTKFVEGSTSDVPEHLWRNFLDTENYLLQ
jgi:hypothetical protein